MATAWGVLWRAERPLLIGLRHCVALALLVVVGGLNALLLPLFPPPVKRFFATIFHLDQWVDIVLVNGYLALQAVVFWIGVFDVLRVVVLPTETGTLDLLLSKPLSRSHYLLWRVVPRLAVAAVIGLVGSLVVVAAATWVGPVNVARTAAGALVSVALGVVLVAFVAALSVVVRDGYRLLLGAFALWMASVLPGSVYMYRPDVIDPLPAFRDVIIFPMNLAWMAEGTVAGLVAVALLVLALGVVATAGLVFERRDAV